MEMGPGKLFVGGISWDTSEERLREYFETFGEVVEAVIMKDRSTGRARGFGFVVFANASVAQKVVRERHIIDGRTVEAKKAVPRDDNQNFNRNDGSIQGSPGPVRTKKIFVGGLASTVTESDFKRYFDQFGTTTDVVVMYDHNTQRPRGFGFITYDSGEAVDKVLFKTFHELNGKRVEVKRAMPRELSPGPIRSQSGGHYYGLNRVSGFLNTSNQGYNSSSRGGYGMRMVGRFSPSTVGRSGYAPHSPSNYSMRLNLDSSFSLNYGARGDFGLGYGRGMNSYYSGDTNRYGSPIGSDVGFAGSGTLFNSANQSLWGSGSLNYSTNPVPSKAFDGSRTVNAGLVENFGSIREIWGSSPVSAQREGSGSLGGGNIGYGSRQNNFDGWSGCGRNNGGTARTSSYSVTNNLCDGGFGKLYGGESFYSDHTWGSPSSQTEGHFSFGYQSGAAADATPSSAVGYVGGYSMSAGSNGGIAA